MHVETDAEVRPLRAALRDLVALSAIPTAWIGSEPSAVAAGLADALVDLLQLDFAFVRLSDPGGAGAVEVTRGSAWTGFPGWLEGHLATNGPFPRKEVLPDAGDDSVRRRGFAVPVGVNGEGGVVVAASERGDFPTPTDQLLLSLAANHAAVAFQGARLIHERKQAEEELRTARNELEVKVAERTAELQLANDELSSLRRVATLVAQGVRPAEIFSAVSDEVGRLFGSDTAAVVRFDHDDPAQVVVGLAKSFEGITVGTRWELHDPMASAEVYRTGRSARVDAVDWSAVRRPIAEAGSRLGTVSTVASPIVVEGHLWGAITVAAKEPLSLDAEGRLEKFTDLVATAIANADSRSELAASRRRIVAASDEARRRIERDLHDGVQQQLVSLGLEVGAMEAALPPEPELAAQLARLTRGLGGVLEDLVEISRGIHPAILSHGGLGPALKTLARRSAVRVELDANIDSRLPEQVQVAAYYVVSEALTNAAKHARAAVVHVGVVARDRTIRLSIRDDGVGGADPGHGSGLVGLQDRVEALGGTIRVDSPSGKGTSLVVTLPLDVEPMRG